MDTKFDSTTEVCNTLCDRIAWQKDFLFAFNLDMEIDLNEDISSKIYPLTRAWLRVEVLKKFLGSFVVAGVLVAEFYMGDAGVFIKFFFNLNFIIFIILGFVTTVSAIAFLGVFQAVRWYLGFEYTFARMRIEYRTDRKQTDINYLLYSDIREVIIKRGFIDRIFGYAVLWINPPTWKQRLYFTKLTGYSFVIRGLTKNEAVHISEFVQRIISSNVPAASIKK